MSACQPLGASSHAQVSGGTVVEVHPRVGLIRVRVRVRVSG